MDARQVGKKAGLDRRVDIFAQKLAAAASQSGAFPDADTITVTLPDDFVKYVIIAIILGFAALAWRSWQIKQASPDWPYVMGEMLEARARVRNETGDQAGTPTHEWFTEVRYRYTVNGESHVGTRLRAFGRNHTDEQSALQEIAPFQPGTMVKVYYDPAKPGASVLIPG